MKYMIRLKQVIDMDDKRQHLIFIEDTISRMSSNSFLTRGWAVTILTALFTLYGSCQNKNVLFVILGISVVFWIIDSYYLMLERGYRDLYDKVRKQKPSEITYEMKTSGVSCSNWFRAIRSFTFLFSYLLVLIIGVLLLVR